MAKHTKPNPRDWGDDELSEFIETARINTLATFQQLPAWYQKLREIDHIFSAIATNLDNPQDHIAPFFLYLCHGSFRAATQVVLSTQLAPAYMILRGCLEFALYGHFMHTNPEKFEIWQQRGEDEASRRAVRRTFTAAAVLASLEQADRREHEVAKALYDRTIDHGAHPNELALFGSLSIDETDEAIGFEVAYLRGDSVQLRLALKTAAQVGVCSLRIFSLIFPERFAILDLMNRIRAVSRDL